MYPLIHSTDIHGHTRPHVCMYNTHLKEVDTRFDGPIFKVMRGLVESGMLHTPSVRDYMIERGCERERVVCVNMCV
jgi:hypothetical protein